MALFVLRAGLNYFFVYSTECASLYREETENQRSKVAGPRSHSRGRAGIWGPPSACYTPRWFIFKRAFLLVLLRVRGQRPVGRKGRENPHKHQKIGQKDKKRRETEKHLDQGERGWAGPVGCWELHLSSMATQWGAHGWAEKRLMAPNTCIKQTVKSGSQTQGDKAWMFSLTFWCELVMVVRVYISGCVSVGTS